jgi:hypothetical protein
VNATPAEIARAPAEIARAYFDTPSAQLRAAADGPLP